MSREVILKYLTEFNAWVKGQEVYVMFSNGGHRLVDSLEDFNEDVKYIVLKDSYFFYRKALAEGKTIQANINYWSFPKTEEFNWQDIASPDSFNKFNLLNLRIKPDEPKFKVGDFVTPLNREINCSVWQIDNILSCNTLVSGNTMLDPRTIRLWTPVKGEWCWFYDEASNKYSHLAKFNGMWKNKFISTIDTPWQFCEPFLNSPPSYLKDKQ